MRRKEHQRGEASNRRRLYIEEEGMMGFDVNRRLLYLKIISGGPNGQRLLSIDFFTIRVKWFQEKSRQEW